MITINDDVALMRLENTNEPPGEIDHARLTSRVATIDKEIDSLDREMEKIMQRRVALRKERERCAATTSPLRRYPNEIMLEIFNNLSISEKSYIRTASQVCHTWRKIVLGAPLFWTDIILPGSRDDRTFDDLWEQLDLFISRAQGRPMFIAIGKLSDSVLDLLFDSIFKSESITAHWAGISLHTSKINHIRQIPAYYNKYPDEAVYLSSLAFTSADVPIEHHLLEEDMNLMCLSALRSLRIDMRYFLQLVGHFYINWNGLTNLSMVSPWSSDEFVKAVLNHCPNLESLHIHPEDPTLGFDDNEPILTLKYLRKLSIISDYHPSSLLVRISTPLLEELNFDFCSPSDPDDTIAVQFLGLLDGHLRLLRCTGDIAFHIFEPLGSTNFLRSLTTLQIVQPYQLNDEESYNSEYPTNIFGLINNHIDCLLGLQVIEIQGHEPLGLDDTASLRHLLEVCCGTNETKGDRSIRKCPNLRRFLLTQDNDGLSLPREGLTTFRERGILVDQPEV